MLKLTHLRKTIVAYFSHFRNSFNKKKFTFLLKLFLFYFLKKIHENSKWINWKKKFFVSYSFFPLQIYCYIYNFSLDIIQYISSMWICVYRMTLLFDWYYIVVIIINNQNCKYIYVYMYIYIIEKCKGQFIVVVWPFFLYSKS